MTVYVNKVRGIDDAIVTMFMSKRSWTREKEMHIRDLVQQATVDYTGKIDPSVSPELNDHIEKLCKWGVNHITMLRFVDFSITVEGLHRGGQDDWDAHAKRFDNRIIRTSTRLSTFADEMSDFYKHKIIPTDAALGILGITTPDTIMHNGVSYVRTHNGYIREDMKDDKDVKRGLYMLSIPSNFIFKIDLTEYGHVFKERREGGTANPEVKQVAEAVADGIQNLVPWFTRDLLMSIKN